MGSGGWDSSIFGGWDEYEPKKERATEPASVSPARSKTALVVRETDVLNVHELEHLGVDEHNVPAEWQVGDTILDLYRVEDILGAGAMGTVYRVRHLVWSQDLAVKSPKPEMLDFAGGRDAFVSEAETWVGLGLHPHVVTCYYVRLLGGIPRVFAEYVDGGNLAEWIRGDEFYRGGADETLARMLDVSIQIAWGLGFAHQRGLVHQDVKPANVMTLSDAGGYVAKVTDFGLASSDAGAHSLVGGTFEYLSPEQAEIIRSVKSGRGASGFAPVTLRSDIWSWGICVLDMFAGGQTCQPGGHLAAEVLEDYLAVGAADGRGVKIPDAVADILRRCFRKDPEERPAGMLEVADDLAQLYEEFTGKPYWRQQPRAGAGSAAYLNNRALSYLDLGREKEALSAWQAALAADPQHPETIFNRGVHLWRKGKLTDDALIQQLRSVQQLHQADWVDEYLLGLVHLERGDRGAAADMLREALRLSEGDAEVQKAVALIEGSEATAAVEPASALLTAHRAHILSTDASADGRFILSGDDDGAVKLSSADDGKVVREFSGHQDSVKSVSFGGDGKYALSGSADHSVRLWDISTGHCRRTFRTRLIWRLSLLSLKVLSIAVYWALTLVVVGAIMFALMYVATGITQREAERQRAEAAEAQARANYYRYGTYGYGGYNNYRSMTEMAQRPSFGSMVFMQLVAYFTWAIFVSFIAMFLVYFLGFFRKLDRTIHHLNGHKGPVNSVRLSAGGDFVISGSADKTVRVWDVKTGRRRHTFRGHWSEVTEVCLSGDDRLALSASWDGTAALWDIEAGSRLRTFAGHTGAVNCARFTHDNLSVVSGSSDNTLRLWDVETGRTLRQFVGHTQAVACLAVSPDDRFIVSGGWDRSIRLWDAETGRCVHTIRDLTDPVLSLGFGADGKSVVYATSDRVMRTRRLPASVEEVCLPMVCRVVSTIDVLRVEHEVDEKLRRGLEALDNSEFDAAFALIGEARAYAGYERTPEALDAWARLSLSCHRTGVAAVWAHRILDGHIAPVSSVNISRDGRVAVSSGVDNSIRVWEVATGYCLHTINVGQPLTAACLSPAGRRALSGDQNTFLAEYGMRMWDVEHGRWLKKFYGHEATVTSLCMTADEKFALSGSADGTLRVWDVETARCLRTVKAHGNTVTSVCLTADGRHVVTAGADAFIHVFELSTGRFVRTLKGHEGTVTSVCASGDGRLLLSSGADGTVKVWDAKTGDCLKTLEGHNGSVSSVAVSADARFAISGGHDYTLRLWSLETGRELQTIEGHEDSVGHVCLSRDGRYALSGSADKSIRLWNMDWRLEVRRPADWDEGADPYLDQFMALLCPYGPAVSEDAELSEPMIRRALTRGQKPAPDADHAELFYELRCAGYGWLRPEVVRRRLKEATRDWRGAPPPRRSVARFLSDALSVLMSYVRLVRARYIGPLVLLVLLAILLIPLLYFLVLYVSDMRRERSLTTQQATSEQPTPTPTPTPTPLLADADWQSYSPTSVGVSLELPCSPASQPGPIPYGVRSTSSYVCENLNFRAEASRMNFVGSVPFPARRLAEMMADGINGQRGVVYFSHTVEPFKGGALVSCRYIIGNDHFEKRAVVVSGGSSVRIVDLTFRQDDDDAARAAQRILDSLAFK